MLIENNSQKHPRFLCFELSFAIIIKLFLLFLLWWVCFSHPNVSEKDTTVLEQHILSRG